MKKKYNPKDIEQPLYADWERNGYFKANTDVYQNSYCIMLPPPNITGTLHIGHALQHTMMDILIRYHRMQGQNTLWQTGIDHAGIATQIMIERTITEEEGKTRYNYGRDVLIKKIWKWKNKFGKNITNQMRRLGNSMDWDRERFTMDQGFSSAVNEAFIRMYQKDLIYCNKRLVNWDPKFCTAISDLEIEKREIKGFMWYLRYPLMNGVKTSNGLDYVIVATTRPETSLGDTALAVNPKDLRYKNLIGKFVILPIINRVIPVVSDKNIDINKGTGCVKITPAHDFNDYDIGKRHGLPMVNIFTLDGKVRHKAEVFDTHGITSDVISGEIPIFLRGLERFSARNEIILEFERLGLLQKVEHHDIIVPYSDRSNIVIEPMLTDQWYLRTTEMSKIAIIAVETGEIQFIPKKYENMYFSWMNNIQDWCISRQIWWGHRIPAWYDSQGKIYVGHDEKEIRQKNNLDDKIALHQDEDVLDTWFSSALWTFASLGWPKETEELNIFHPTDIVISGFDIIFFWIARMIMLTMYFIEDKNGKPQIPFKTVYITGLIRDEEGQKMSKTKGNVIDPLDIIDGISLDDLIKKRTNNMMQPKFAKKIRNQTEKKFPHGIEPHGTDALRLTLAALSSTSRDLILDMKRLNGYRNFCNKLWNASRFVLIHTKDKDCGFNDEKKVFLLADKWILAKFNQTIKLFREALDNYRLDLAAAIICEFVWNQFCDWYLELSKPVIINGSEEELRGTRYTLISILEALLRLIHPVLPFITETIWKKVKIITKTSGDTIMLQPFPTYNINLVDSIVLADIEWIKKIITAVRTIRTEMNISLCKYLELFIRNPSLDVRRQINNNLNLICNLTRLKNIIFLSINDQSPISITKVVDGIELLIPMINYIDKDIELKRLDKNIKCISNKIDCIKKKLHHQGFINFAPEEIIIKKRDKLDHYQKLKTSLLQQKSIIDTL